MIKLIILDVDGVLTDGRKYYDREGNVRMKTFCDKDWTAIKRFRAEGIQVIFLTGDPFNVTIAENRNIDVIVNRQNGTHTDKADYLEQICKDYSVDPSEIVFVGDDIFDVKIMQKVGYAFCPADTPEIVRVVAEPLPVNGGDNVIMCLFDKLASLSLLSDETLNRSYDEHLEKVYELDLKEKF